MSVTREERIKAEAYKRWEMEGHPDGAHERHWREASDSVELYDKMTGNAESGADAEASKAAKPKRPRAKKQAS